MSEKIALITGSTSGIGYITALELAKLGFHTVLHARNREKAEQTQQQIVRQTGNKAVDILLADFARLDEIPPLASEFTKRYDRLDLLVNNAGLILGNNRQVTPEGYELTITINHLSPFLLTTLLYGTLKDTPGARIINVASMAHRGAVPDFNDFHLERSYSGWKAYCNSKLYNIMFTAELARREVPAWSLHPGTVATRFSVGAGGWIQPFFSLFRPFLSTPERGASTSIYLCTEKEIPAPSGTYFVNSKPAKVRNRFYAPDNNRRLWELSEKLTGK